MVQPESEWEYDLLQAVNKNEITEVQQYSNLKDLHDAKYFDYYLVIKALYKSHIDMAKLLIKKGCRVYKKSGSTYTVLHYAVQSGDIDLIKTLLAKGASPDILRLNEYNKTPLHLAIDRNQSSTVELFMSKIDITNFDEQPYIRYAIQENTVPVLSHLIAKGFFLKKKSRNHENLKFLDILLSCYCVKNIMPNNHNAAPAYFACIRGNLKIVKKSVNSGLPVNIPVKLKSNTWSCIYDYAGFTLLHFAVKHVKLNIVKFLLTRGADILAQAENGSSPLHVAFENKQMGTWNTWQEFDDNNAIIDLILKANMKLKSNPVNKHGLSHFHIACSRDEHTVVEHFLKLGASVDKPVKAQYHLYKGFYPLHFAAKFRCKKTVKILLENGADIGKKDFNEMTALHVAAKEPNLDGVSMLLQYGAGTDVALVDSEENTPLHWAFEKRNYRIIDLLLSLPNISKSNPTNRKGISHFHIACSRDNVDVVKSFIVNGVSVDTCVPVKSTDSKVFSIFNSLKVDYSGCSPLHFAVNFNRANIVRLLLHSGANLGIQDNKGFTPLHKVCQYTRETFEEFIQSVLSGNVTQQLDSLTDIVDVDEKGPKLSEPVGKIDWSSNRKEHMEIIHLLFNIESDINCIDNNGNTPLFWIVLTTNSALCLLKELLENNMSCSKALSTQIIESLSNELHERRKLIYNYLLEMNVNLNKCSADGSLLHCLCCGEEKYNIEMMKLTLKKGANVNAENSETQTPLHIATLREKPNLMCVLLDNGANANCIDPRENLTPLLIACKSPCLLQSNAVVLLISKGAIVNAKQSDGKTALHNLASLCMYEELACSEFEEVCPLSAITPVVSALLEAGANINSRDTWGYTALHVACTMKNHEFISMLLEYGADVNVEDNYGRTVCNYLYRIYDGNKQIYRSPSRDHIGKIVLVFQRHIIKMNVIGLLTSDKTKSSMLACVSMVSYFQKLTDQQINDLVQKCQTEVQLLRDEKIHDDCTLYDIVFKNENQLSRLVKNPMFEDIIHSELFDMMYPNYGYLLKFKYREGLHRNDLLPAANFVLSSLADLHLPEECSANICKYFNNAELTESVEILSNLLETRR